MLVPRSFLYSASAPIDVPGEKRIAKRMGRPGLETVARTLPVRQERHTGMSSRSRMAEAAAPSLVPVSPSWRAAAAVSSPVMEFRSWANDARRTVSQPMSIPSRGEARSSRLVQPERPQERQSSRRPSTQSKHRADSLPPSVAALLAVTAIPPPHPNQFRRKKSTQRRVSIDDLVQDWRSEASLKSSLSSHASMDVLLESLDEAMHEQFESGQTTPTPRDSLASRSASCDSIPSLDADDDRSVLSLGSPVTPKSIRTHRAGSLGGKKALPVVEDCGLDHPLGTSSSEQDDDDEDMLGSPLTVRAAPSRRQSSFKSNLTASLQALKDRALSSLQSLSLGPASGPAFSDQTLWSHPYIFPHFTSEVRPASFAGTPSRSQRNYLNPILLNFDEQQGPYRQALHTAAFDDGADAPMIQMQTYSRAPSRSRKSSRRASSSSSGGGPDPRSEAGRALSGPPLTRQREPRENSDFLRVVVLEMNMRRTGKLEEGMGGRARIWLPPRKVAVATSTSPDDARTCSSKKAVPQRWVAVSPAQL